MTIIVHNGSWYEVVNCKKKECMFYTDACTSGSCSAPPWWREISSTKGLSGIVLSRVSRTTSPRIRISRAKQKDSCLRRIYVPRKRLASKKFSKAS